MMYVRARGLRRRGVRLLLAIAVKPVLPSTRRMVSALQINSLSTLDSLPARPAADASPMPSRTPAHGSRWIVERLLLLSRGLSPPIICQLAWLFPAPKWSGFAATGISVPTPCARRTRWPRCGRAWSGFWRPIRLCRTTVSTTVTWTAARCTTWPPIRRSSSGWLPCTGPTYCCGGPTSSSRTGAARRSPGTRTFTTGRWSRRSSSPPGSPWILPPGRTATCR